jgi:uncharacterized coiled-coil protein SlyX
MMAFIAADLGLGLGMDKDLAERLEKLESNLAHLEHLYDQLNQVVLEQSRTLTRLQGAQQKVAQTVESMELDRIKATNPKPPHYQ